jgi:hypothetical protein
VLLPLLLISIIAVLQPLQVAHASASWSSPIEADSNSGLNSLPSALQATNGTLWVAWQSDVNSLTTGRMDIIYKTFNPTTLAWSSDQSLTTSGQNANPDVIQLANGTIGIFWVMRPAKSYEIFYTKFSTSGWSTPIQITTTTLNDTQPSAAVDRSGNVWLVWTRVNSTNTSNPPTEQLYYKVLKGGVWTNVPDIRLTTGSNQIWGSSVAVTKDGAVRVAYSNGTTTSTYQIYGVTYSGGSWSRNTQLVSSSSTDERPSLIQDRNGTLWLFWGRQIVSGSNEYFELWDQYSYNVGATWSAQNQITSIPTPTGSKLWDSFMPSAVQTNYGTRYIAIFYASNYNVPTYNIYWIESTGIYPVHDVVVSGLTATNNLATSWEYTGGLKSIGQSATETITVSVANIGDYVESVTVTLSVTNTTTIPIGSSSSQVSSGNTMKFFFYWNTTGVKSARYGLSVTITLPAGEWTIGNMPDGSYSQSNMVHIIPLGDIDQDGSVTITDFSVFVSDFNYSVTCNCSNYTPYADIQDTGTINIVDVAVASANFNTYT